MPTHVSLVIRSYGIECLPEIFAIVEQQVAPHIQINEIVIVNGHPRQALDQSIFPASKSVLVTPIESSYTPGRALNAGIRLTTGEFVVFLSGHAVPLSKLWLQAMCAPFSNPHVGGVLGPQIPRIESNWGERFYRNLWYNSSVLARLFHHFNVANAAIRRALWEHHHFNEAVEGCEDRLWARHFRTRHAAEIVFSKQAAVLHSHVCSIPASARYFLWLGKAAIRSRFIVEDCGATIRNSEAKIVFDR